MMKTEVEMPFEESVLCCPISLNSDFSLLALSENFIQSFRDFVFSTEAFKKNFFLAKDCNLSE